jgi:hypothetical protein
MLATERLKIIQWVHHSADEQAFKCNIKPIIEKNCIICHNEQANNLPNFNQFSEIKTLTRSDDGISYASLTRISHIHLFGISFIFIIIGGIFSLSTSNHYKSIKYTAIVMPFLFLLIDVASWWLTKLSSHFARLVI